MNNETFIIEEKDLDLAKDICKYIDNPGIRERAVANAIAANIAEKYFENIIADTKSGLHNISQVLEELEISDIYLNNSYIDVRLYFESNELCVPKSHFDNDILPIAYMFIRVNEDLTGGMVTGFITPSEIDITEDINLYYPVREEELKSFYDIEPLLNTKDYVEVPEDFSTRVFEYLEGSLADKKSFFRILISSKSCREELLLAARAQNIFNFISVTSDNVIEPVLQEDTNNDMNGITNLELNTEDAGSNSLDEIYVEPLRTEDLTKSGELLIEDNTESEIEGLDSNDEELLVEEDDFTNSNELLIEDNTEHEIGELVSNDEELLVEDEDFANSNDLLIEDNTEHEIGELVSDSENLLVEEDDFTNSNELLIEDNTENEIEGFVSDREELAGEDEDFTIETPQNTEIQDTRLSEDQEISKEIGALENSFEAYSDLIDSNIDNDNPQTFQLEITSSDSTTMEKEVPSKNSQEEIEEPVVDIEEENYSTTTTPSLNNFEEEFEDNTLEDMLEKTDCIQENEKEDPNIEVSEPKPAEEDSTVQINTLFNNNDTEQINTSIDKQRGKKTPILPLIGIVAILAAVGYWGFDKIKGQNELTNNIPESGLSNIQEKEDKISEQEAMPVETVENINAEPPSNEGTSVSIPAIEQNLDASILVSNLSVNWEVPAGYITNTAAKRYFTKLGKVIQLNLKTELLLLSKPPITNKITVELEYNKGAQKFNVKGLTASSGEKTVDEIILKTVKNALDMKINTNMNNFGSIQGNPVLVINL